MRFLIPNLLALFLGLLLCIDASAKDEWLIREDGAGPAKIGMSLAQLNRILHENLQLPKAKDEQACFYENAHEHPDVLFMIVSGRLARVEVSAPGVTTSTGIQVGDSEAHALQDYGARLKTSPHAYIREQGGHYLTAKSTDGRNGIRFETDKGKITRFYAGRFDAIQYIEGCE